jgi:sulfite reductase alpha subunit-like flavoprotein
MSAGIPDESWSPPGRTILILYGSETGNSQEIAEDLDKCVQRLHFESRLAEMDSVQLVGFFLPSFKGHIHSLFFPPRGGAVESMH